MDKLFAPSRRDILSIYFTAGFPELVNTVKIACLLGESGADLIEIGIPYSDPVADGPIIQKSNQAALDNGMTVKILMDQLRTLRQKSDIPVILMGYLNPVLQYGVEEFCRQCQILGIDGLIIPDLPMSEYMEHYQRIFHQFNLHHIFLVTPQTTEERLRLIDDRSTSFIYAVSDSSVTGKTRDITSSQRKYFQRLGNMKLTHPFIIGFGIYDASTFREACDYADGAIIGSAFIKAISHSNNIKQTIKDFITPLRSHDNTTAT